MKNCLVCKKEFKPKSKKANKFCSLPCYWQSKIGTPAPKGAFKKGDTRLIGNQFSVGNKPNKTSFGKEEKHPQWKGKNAGYNAMHSWIEKQKGKASNHKCKCGKQAKHWSSIDHLYKRNLDDYVAKCISCHKKYDIRKGFIDINNFKYSI